MLVNLQTIIGMAEKGNYCIPAFNVYNTETVMGVIDAAEQEKAPVIIQVYPRLLNEEVGFYLCPAVVAAAQRASVPVCFHLDHGPSEWEVTRALRWGCTGIMLDGSVHDFDKNVEMTKHIVDTCKSVGIGVEGEIGHVGSVNDAAMDEFTSPEEAAEFVKQTGVTCLAVLVGNAHGHYKKPPKLDIERIKAIREATGGTPLVLHGGSGIPDEQVKAAIAAGIRKMNIGTDVCCAFADGTKATLDDPQRSLAVDLFMKKPIQYVKELAVSKIRLTGADGKAQ
ncbi:MAG: class II fructose-bisphosphate aldolase [Clostridia bacterium]|jgi:ketose-bisphosphate aldolase|nr:class II fructose-bisphosphate aldolase [Clostridia bacterium]